MYFCMSFGPTSLQLQLTCTCVVPNFQFLVMQWNKNLHFCFFQKINLSKCPLLGNEIWDAARDHPICQERSESKTRKKIMSVSRSQKRQRNVWVQLAKQRLMMYSVTKIWGLKGPPLQTEEIDEDLGLDFLIHSLSVYNNVLETLLPWFIRNDENFSLYTH